MAETVFHPHPHSLSRTETRVHVIDGPPPEPAVDWERIDRVITLMAYVMLDRVLRNTSTNAMDLDIKFQVIERLSMLIEEFRSP